MGVGIKYVLVGLLVLSGSVIARTSQADHEIQEGDKYFSSFQIEKSLWHYQKAVEADPKNFEARMKFLRANNSMGQNLRDMKADKKLSEYYFRQNVDLSEKLYRDFPNHAESAFSVAIAYGNLALYSTPKEKVRLSRDIEKNLKKAIELNPEFPYSYLGLGIFYREVAKITFLERFFANLFFGEIPHGTTEDAIKNFKISIEKDPKFIFTHYHYAQALIDADRPEEAMREYQLVLSLPATDSSDPYLKEVSKKLLSDLQDEFPSISADQQGSATHDD